MNIPASQIAAELKEFCGRHDSQKDAAKALRVTDSQLSMALSGKSNVIPGKILKKLGYVAALAYFKIGEEPKAKSKKPTPAPKTTAKKAAAKKAKPVAKKAKPAAKKAATKRKVGMPRELGMGYYSDTNAAVEGDPYKEVAEKAYRNSEASTAPNAVIDINVRGE